MSVAVILLLVVALICNAVCVASVAFGAKNNAERAGMIRMAFSGLAFALGFCAGALWGSK